MTKKMSQNIHKMGHSPRVIINQMIKVGKESLILLGRVDFMKQGVKVLEHC